MQSIPEEIGEGVGGHPPYQVKAPKKCRLWAGKPLRKEKYGERKESL